MNKKAYKEPLLLAGIRILLGLVFIFSSFVKGVDPLGTAYRVEDYLDAYGLYSLYEYALGIAIFLILVEFLLGVAMLFRLQPKLASLGVLLIMIIFTFVTFFDALYNMVPDCGCFGDAIKLSNWGTFYKNIALIVLAVYVFVFRKHMLSRKSVVTQYLILTVFVGVFGWFNYYNLAHLPLIDFRDWKIGKDMRNSGTDKMKVYVTYRNKLTDERKEFLSPDYPWNDSLWMSHWTFESQRIDDSEVIRKHGIIMEDSLGNDWTDDIVGYPGYQFILVSPDLENANKEGMQRAGELYAHLLDTEAEFVLLCSSDYSIVEEYREACQIYYNTYLGDDTELKAMIRSNPGMVLLHNGVVINKWHYNDFPSNVEEINELMRQIKD